MSPFLRPAFKILELDIQDGALKAVHSVIEADFFVVVALPLGMVAKSSKTNSDIIIVSEDGAGFAVSSQVLARIKAEAAAAPQGTRKGTVIAGAVSLRGVL